MRIAIVTESFLPHINGVTNSVCRILEHLARRGHEVLVVAPGPGPGGPDELRIRMGNHARLSVYGRDWDGVRDELLGHYARVVGRTVGERAA